ncbi:MAG: hypothetical protein M3266_02935 [Actinomycetota bacterium]|nr:hypothetical protein [Actinomycetota bacterium]
MDAKPAIDLTVGARDLEGLLLQSLFRGSRYSYRAENPNPYRMLFDELVAGDLVRVPTTCT